MVKLCKQKPKKHSQCRESICVVCLRKNNQLRDLTNSLIVLIKLYVYNKFDESDHRFPTVICGGCRLTLRKCSQTNNRYKNENSLLFFLQRHTISTIDTFNR